MAFRNPFFDFDPFEDLLFNAFRADSDKGAIAGRQDSTIFPRYRAVSDQNAMVLEIELPGVDRKTIELDVNRKQLTVSAKRPVTSGFGKTAGQQKAVENSAAVENGGQKGAEGSVEKAVAEVRTEDNCLMYSAKFRLGYDVEVDHVVAEFADGILRIRVPRHEESSGGRRIEIGDAK
jgi:HSP20 family molecular chaperone IbpA